MNKVSRGFIKGDHAPTASLRKKTHRTTKSSRTGTRPFDHSSMGFISTCGLASRIFSVGLRHGRGGGGCHGNKDLDPLITRS